MRFKNLNDSTSEEIQNDAEYFMPTFLMRKGIRVNFNKETKELES